MNSGTKQATVAKLRRHYPNLTEKIITLIVKEKSKRCRRLKNGQYQQILRNLSKYVVGQELALERLATTLSSQEKLSKNQVFLFVGPTGVGKTELAKTVAKVKGQKFVTLSMNLYTNELSYGDLWGSGAGYVGSSDKPHFATELESFKPTLTSSTKNHRKYKISNAVILFDEFEKAHPKIRQSMLTLFDENHCTFHYTNESDRKNITLHYTFEKSVFICTSNLFQDAILDAFNRNLKIDEITTLFEKSCKSISQDLSFSQELLSRTTIIPFGPIPRGIPFQRIIKIKMLQFIECLKEAFSCKVDIENEPILLQYLEAKLYNDGINIRKLTAYFDQVKGKLNKCSDQFGDLTSKKLIFTVDDEQPVMMVKVYIEQIGEYYNMHMDPIPFP